MKRCVREEADEVAKIPVSNAGAHPRTVMIVDLNTEAAVRTVVTTRWSHDLTRGAVAESFGERWV